jgi:hypothetical protein
MLTGTPQMNTITLFLVVAFLVAGVATGYFRAPYLRFALFAGAPLSPYRGKRKQSAKSWRA